MENEKNYVITMDLLKGCSLCFIVLLFQHLKNSWKTIFHGMTSVQQAFCVFVLFITNTMANPSEKRNYIPLYLYNSKTDARVIPTILKNTLVCCISMYILYLFYYNVMYVYNVRMQCFVYNRHLPDEIKPGMYETLIDRLEKQEVVLRHLQTTLVEASKETKNKNQQIEHLNSMLSEIMVKLGEKDNQVEKLENELREIRKKIYVEHPTEPISDNSKSNMRALPPLQQHGSHEDVTYTDLLQTVDGFQQQIFNKREAYNRRHAGAVAFSASIQSNRAVYKHEVLVFGDELLNEGSGYNRGDGIFTVPQSGVYVFTWSITAGTHPATIRTDLYTNLMHNGSPVGYIDSDSDEHNFGSATGVVVLRCSYGDHVFVRTDSAGNVISDYHAKSTFSGWLLF